MTRGAPIRCEVPPLPHFCSDRAPEFVWAPQPKIVHQIVRIDFEKYIFFSTSEQGAHPPQTPRPHRCRRSVSPYFGCPSYKKAGSATPLPFKRKQGRPIQGVKLTEGGAGLGRHCQLCLKLIITRPPVADLLDTPCICIDGKLVGQGAPAGLKQVHVVTVAHPRTILLCKCPPPCPTGSEGAARAQGSGHSAPF